MIASVAGSVVVQSEGVIASAASEAGAPLTGDALIASLGEGEEAIDRLLAAIVAIKRRQRCLDAQLNGLLDQLQQLHERGDLDASFHFNDTAFSWSPGRVQFTYPEPVLALEQQLKLARKTAEGNGSAVRRHGRPFWTVKLPST